MIKAWEEVIHTAIIGTDKKQVSAQALPEEIAAIAERIAQAESEHENQFLATAAVIYNYRRAGSLPAEPEAQPIEACAPETKPYASESAQGALRLVISDFNQSLLYFWLKLCSENGMLAYPEFVPDLFHIAANHVTLRELIIDCTGERGQWMRPFNSSWDFKPAQSYQQLFEYGTTQERILALTEWRKADPAEALEMVRQCWKSENANLRAEMVAALQTGLNSEDNAFLASILTDRSQKVKEAALNLLKQLPDSEIVKAAMDFVDPLISLKKSGSLLGLRSKETLEINLDFELPDTLKSYGISDLNATQNFSEKEYTLDELIALIPPDFWEKKFEMNAAQVLELFSKEKQTKKYISAFAISADAFRNAAWAEILFRDYDRVCYRAAEQFPLDLQETLMLQTLAQSRNLFTMNDGGREWTLDFAMKVLEITSKEPYSFDKSYYRPIIHQFPVSVIEKIGKITVEEGYRQSHWKGISEEIIKLLTIKNQIIQSF